MFLRQTLAVVLKVRDHGDSDKIVTLYTLENGKMAAIAKGAKRSKKRFVNKLELFTLLNIQYAPGRISNLARLDQAETLNGYPGLREEYGRYTASSLCAEQLLLWTKDNDSDEDLFRLFLWALEELQIGATPARTVIFFQVKLLDLLGYRPHMENCIECGTLSAQAAPYRFSLAKNGLTCNNCNREPATTLPISIQTVQLLKKVQELPADKLNRLQFSPAAMGEAFGLLKKYTSSLLGRDLNSWTFLGAA